MNRNPTVEQIIADIDRQLERHQILHVLEAGQPGGPSVLVVKIGEPGTRIMSFQLTFTLEGIAIQGDFVPERNGTVCREHKSLGWFGSELSAGYLASKFLQKKWDRGNAAQWALDTAADWTAAAAELAALADGSEALGSPEQFRYAVDAIRSDAGLSALDWTDGPWDYVPQEVAALAAIQRTFRRLWWKANPQTSTSTEPA